MFTYSGYCRIPTDTQGDLICPVFRSDEDLFSTWTESSDAVTVMLEEGQTIPFSATVDNWAFDDTSYDYTRSAKWGESAHGTTVFNIIGGGGTLYPATFTYTKTLDPNYQTPYYESFNLTCVNSQQITCSIRNGRSGGTNAYINFSALPVYIDAEGVVAIGFSGANMGTWRPVDSESRSTAEFETEYEWGTHRLATIYSHVKSQITWTIHTFGAQLESFIAYGANIIENATTPEDDPFEAVTGGSGTGGGTGTGTLGGGEAVDFPALPTLSALSTGMVTIYNPTLSQLNSLASYLWNADASTIDFWKKLVANPMDLILGLSIVPVNVYGAGTKHVFVGNIDTGVSMTYTNSQYVEVNCGSLDLPEVWGAYLDYEPYTKLSIYLPYCGTHPLMADEVIGKTIAVKYHVDVMSGACCAYVKCGNHVLYQFNGICAEQFPLNWYKT